MPACPQLSLASASLSFNAPAPLRVTASRASPVEMKVEDLVGGINDPIFGGTPEGKIFDPLGLGADESALYRRRCVEIKHGRICMVAFLGMTIGPNEVHSVRNRRPAVVPPASSRPLSARSALVHSAAWRMLSC